MHNGGGWMERKARLLDRERDGVHVLVRFTLTHRRRQSNARPVRYLIRSRLSSTDSITRIHVTLPWKRGKKEEEEEEEEEGEGGKGRWGLTRKGFAPFDLCSRACETTVNINQPGAWKHRWRRAMASHRANPATRIDSSDEKTESW